MGTRNAGSTQAAARPAPDRLTWVAVVVTVLLWASAFIGIRSSAHWFGAGPLALLRLTVGSLALGVAVLVRSPGLPRGRDRWPVAGAGVLWFGVYNVALNAGERSLDAGTAAMVVNLGPLIIALLAGLFLNEGFPRPLLLGMAVSFAGAVVVGLAGSGGGRTSLGGVALCLLAALTYAAGVVLQKGVVGRVGALPVTFCCCVIGALCCLPWVGELGRELASAPASAIWTVVYLGVFPTAIAFTTWAFALRTIPAGRLGATTYAVPAVVVGLSALLLAEVPRVGALVGGALCLAGVAVSRLRRAARPGPVEAPATGAPEVTVVDH